MAKKRKQRVDLSVGDKLAAMQMLDRATIEAVSAQYKVSPATLSRWKKEAKGAKPVAADSLKEALVFFRHAQKDVLKRLRDGTLREPDQGHLYMMQGLRILEGN